MRVVYSIKQPDKDFHQAQKLIQQNLFSQAEVLLLTLVENPKYGLTVLQLLTRIYLQSQKFDDAANILNQLTIKEPTELHFCDSLANLYGHSQQWDKASDCYRKFIEQNQPTANAFFNYAYNLKQDCQYQKSLDNYLLALKHKISQSEEVYLNMAVIYSDHLRQEENAKESLEAALNINPEYVSAIYNLANLYEEEGNKQQASILFSKVIELQPDHYQALARLADVKKFTNVNDHLIIKINRALGESDVSDSTKMNLYYGLGKIFDDCGNFEQAFEHYNKANELNRLTLGPYVRGDQEAYVDKNIRLYTQQWFDQLEPASEASPIFICGMFRSGSTLTEQILAAHSDITAGGERDFFTRRQNPIKAENEVLQFEQSELDTLARKYLSELTNAFPCAKYITDKRPDNFLYIGLIKSLFPNARIIHSVRNPLDNCLSVYFLRLGHAMKYSTSLLDIAHYNKQQLRLMDHWKYLFPDSIFEVDYDKLVEHPEIQVRKLLEFLNLSWDEECLNFHKLKNRVKTASVWQIRQPLYRGSSGRWRNYEEQVKPLINYLNQ